MVESFEAVLAETAGCTTVAVDMRTGLPAGQFEDSGARQCNLEAKKLLRRAASRVFTTPPRPTLQAPTYEEFSRIHRRLAGNGASLQLWGFVPKIAEINRSLAHEHRDRVVEFHPELTWMRLAGRVLNSKHSATGVIERFQVLGGFGIDVASLAIDDQSSGRARADITDALDALSCLAISSGAQRISQGTPPLDDLGFATQIWM